MEKCPEQYKNPKDAALLRRCAARSGIDFGALQTCATGQQGKELLWASASAANRQGIHYGVDGLPTVALNGKVVSKFFDCSIGLSDLVAKICELYTGPKPSACP